MLSLRLGVAPTDVLGLGPLRDDSVAVLEGVLVSKENNGVLPAITLQLLEISCTWYHLLAVISMVMCF